MQEVQDALPRGSIVHGSNRDNYIIESVLGKGGFSVIYLVRDERVRQNLYALKELIKPDKREKEQFTFECEVLMRLEHPVLPRVYRVFQDTDHDRAYVLMDYIEGADLEELRKQQPERRFPLSQLLTILAPIVDAISFLHHQEPPIVHRDIKPANIIVPSSGGKPALVDFGIAKFYEPEGTTTVVRHCSPGYGAPEQYSIGTTPRTDIYGLGATIYTLLTGHVPVDALQRMIQLSEKGEDPLLPIQELLPSLSPAVAATIHRAMATRSADRFPTIEAFWQALQASAEGEDVMESPVTTPFFQQRNSDKLQSMARPTPPVETDALIGDAGNLHSSLSKKPWRLLFSVLLLLVLLLGLSLGAVYWYTAMKSGGNATRPQVAQTQTSEARHSTPSAGTPSTTPRATVPVYPPLVASYAGEISDIVANTKTNMALAGIQQQGRTIRGNFAGLGQAGSFTGTVSTGGHVTFQVTIYNGNGTIAFEGDIKLGGDIAGSYRVLNQNGEFTGEMGLWSVSPA